MKFSISSQAARRLGSRVVHPSHYLLVALLFFAGLELIFALHRWVGALMAVLLVLVGAGIVLVRTEERGAFHPTQIILPILAAAGLTGFALFLPTVGLIHLYFLASAVILFFLLKHGARQAYPTWNWVISTIVLFLNAAAILGWRFHLYAPILLVLPLLFVITFLLGFQAFVRLTQTMQQAALTAAGLSFVITEITWVLQFLPLHFLAQSGIVVALYYVFFHLISVSYERVLTRRDIMEYIGIGGVALLLILATARWT